MPENYIKLDSELKKLVSNFFSTVATQEKKDNQTIYQYTDWNGLKGIIENECLWFTDYRFLNDTSEINYSVGYFGENIFPENKLGRNMFYDGQTNALDSKPFYVASMSSQCNHLNAWRLYADDAKGFAIGFNRKKIEEGWYKPKENESLFASIFNEVNYIDRQNISAEEKEKFRVLGQYYEQIKSNETKILEFRLAIHSLFPLVKHTCYQEEKEIRLSVSDLCYLERGSNSQGLEICRRNNNLIPFIKKPIKIDWITEIWTCPRANEKEAEEKIKKLLSNKRSKNGHSIKVHHSRLPYKNPEKWS